MRAPSMVVHDKEIRSHLTWNIRPFTFSNIMQEYLTLFAGSRHSSYTSHQSRISYTSHGDLLGTKEQKLRSRSSRNQSMVPPNGNHVGDSNHKGHRDFVWNLYIFIGLSFVNFFLFVLGWIGRSDRRCRKS